MNMNEELTYRLMQFVLHVLGIAEKRDPAGSTTGRRMTTWEKLRSPSFKKATRI